MEKHILIITIILSVVFSSIAQNVSISDDSTYVSEVSAVLDLNSTDKGLLIPRVSLDESTTEDPITDPAIGLLIFSKGGLEKDGFWYWSGSEWLMMASLNNSGVINNESVVAEIFESGYTNYSYIDMPNAGTFYGWTSALEGEIIGSPYLSFQDHPTADRIVVGSSGDGDYLVSLNLSFGGSSNPDIIGQVFVNGVGQKKLTFRRHLNSNGDVGSTSISGILSLNAGDKMDLRFTSTTSSEHVKVYVCNLQVSRIGTLQP